MCRWYHLDTRVLFQMQVEEVHAWSFWGKGPIALQGFRALSGYDLGRSFLQVEGPPPHPPHTPPHPRTPHPKPQPNPPHPTPSHPTPPAPPPPPSVVAYVCGQIRVAPMVPGPARAEAAPEPAAAHSAPAVLVVRHGLGYKNPTNA